MTYVPMTCDRCGRIGNGNGWQWDNDACEATCPDCVETIRLITTPEKRILPPMTKDEYEEMAGLVNGAIMLAYVHGCWDDSKNGAIMEARFPSWDKLEIVEPIPRCPKCGSTDLIDWEQRGSFECGQCEHWFDYSQLKEARK